MTPSPSLDHSYALSGLESKSPQKVPPELSSLKLAKKLEDCSLPSIEDVLRHCVHIRENSNEPNNRLVSTNFKCGSGPNVSKVTFLAAKMQLKMW